jgi:enamine deaminase RidA (YjgF/YER057c/UK114 family)
MSLEQDILRLLKEEGYRVNEAIRDALDDFLTILEDEGEEMTEDFDDEDYGDDDD